MKDSIHNSIQKTKLLFKKRFVFSHTTELEGVVSSLSTSEKLLFWVLVGVLILSTLSLFSKANDSFLTQIEARGGSFTEGIVGSPRFINPVLALSDADRDIVSLVYSGLLKATPDGDLIEDLAESYSVSEDERSYDFVLKEGVVFHDGKPVTVDDVIFTISKTLDTTLKSAQRANWDGVVVQKIDDRTVRFTLAHPYAPFLQNMTLGILPKHIWQNIDSEQFPFSGVNTAPIGSGPYKIDSVKKNSSDIPEMYTLKSFKNYALGQPFINKITLRFYQNEASLVSAFDKGTIDSMNSVSPEAIAHINQERIQTTPLPRIFAVFFNQNTAQIFSHKEVRSALDTAVDKNMLIQKALTGYGTVIDSPIPPQSIDRAIPLSFNDETLDRVEEAKSILLKNKWKFDEEAGVWVSPDNQPLRFSIATSNVPELKAVAGILKSTWESVGAVVEIKVFEAGNLNQNIIRTREYDALLFGEVIGRELDLFAFWHSSQRNDPGLNIALYANITADRLLEEGRTLLDADLRDKTYLEFEKEIKKDVPAIFLYSPDFIYIPPKFVQGISLGSVTTAGDRFLAIHTWYVRTDKVWSIFSQ
ncbi:MAG: ABC transporter substrate-binding protein [Candidatus Paceibacterota bacterium]